MRTLIFLFLVAGAFRSTPAAVTLNLSSASLSSETNATLTHTITGLAAGEKVVVERFADLNGNGQIDAGESSVRAFYVTDGVRPVIGGVVNGNVPGDDDAVTNGAIRVDLPFPGLDLILNRQP